MKTLILFLAFASISSFQVAFSQNQLSIESDTTVYREVQISPILTTIEREYKSDELQKFISTNYKFPLDHRINCKGLIVMSFIIEKDGTISSIRFEKKLCKLFDDEAMRMVKTMTSWQPALINCKPVRYKMYLPIKISYLGD